MGYMHIDNLYKNQEILMFKECYALEKIHGTSAHLTFKKGQSDIKFFSGGEKQDKFEAIFNKEELLDKLNLSGVAEVTVYGEAYGGKCQGMSKIYGKELRFTAFDVKIDDCWLAVPQAEGFVKELGLEFVWWTKIPTDEIDVLRDRDSEQAIRNGMGEGHKAEGMVLRPLIELTKNNGNRIIAKHKRDDFKETKTPREVSPEQLKVLADANEVADEWVTPMRLNHVLDKIEGGANMEKMRDIIISMIEDVKREGEGEIVWSNAVSKAIGKKTAQMTKKFFQNQVSMINKQVL